MMRKNSREPISNSLGWSDVNMFFANSCVIGCRLGDKAASAQRPICLCQELHVQSNLQNLPLDSSICLEGKFIAGVYVTISAWWGLWDYTLISHIGVTNSHFLNKYTNVQILCSKIPSCNCRTFILFQDNDIYIFANWIHALCFHASSNKSTLPQILQVFWH